MKFRVERRLRLPETERTRNSIMVLDDTLFGLIGEQRRLLWGRPNWEQLSTAQPNPDYGQKRKHGQCNVGSKKPEPNRHGMFNAPAQGQGP